MRKRAMAAPTAKNLPKDIDRWCNRIPAEEKGRYPIDQDDGGEDDEKAEHAAWAAKLVGLGRDPRAPWKSQCDRLTMDERDAISDSGVEIWNLLEERGIDNVILMGVHTNMCVLGRPFGLRQLAKNGKNVVLMRDMTDTMYNPARWPHVSHFRGHRSDRRAHREVRLPDGHVGPNSRRQAVSLQSGRPSVGCAGYLRGRVQNGANATRVFS